jgi:ferredoxin
MFSVTFLPMQVAVQVDAGTKILVAAKRAKVDIRFGCASCRCGTCGVKIVQGYEHLSAMKSDERELLSKMGLSTTGEIRLSCQARVERGNVQVDLDFQNTYSPDDYT